MRVGKHFLLSGQLVGVGPGLASGFGLTAGYFLNRNQLLQAEVISGSLENHGLDHARTRSQSVGAHFKHFLGNSFYYRTGLDYLKVESDRAVYSRVTVYPYNGSSIVESESSGQFTGSMFGATLAIGNQWQWENFTMGCDWIGLTAPLSTQIASESFTANDFRAKDDLTSDEKLFLKDNKLHLLRFYLGASF